MYVSLCIAVHINSKTHTIWNDVGFISYQSKQSFLVDVRSQHFVPLFIADDRLGTCKNKAVVALFDSLLVYVVSRQAAENPRERSSCMWELMSETNGQITTMKGF